MNMKIYKIAPLLLFLTFSINISIAQVNLGKTFIGIDLRYQLTTGDISSMYGDVSSDDLVIYEGSFTNRYIGYNLVFNHAFVVGTTWGLDYSLSFTHKTNKRRDLKLVSRLYDESVPFFPVMHDSSERDSSSEHFALKALPYLTISPKWKVFGVFQIDTDFDSTVNSIGFGTEFSPHQKIVSSLELSNDLEFRSNGIIEIGATFWHSQKLGFSVVANWSLERMGGNDYKDIPNKLNDITTGKTEDFSHISAAGSSFTLESGLVYKF
jgi:hypothetical protein